jgi:mannosyltransferase OCH1-like enzyme
VHSNSLPHDTFDVLTEAGYSVEVAEYDLEDMLVESPAKKVSLKVARTLDDWSSRKGELLRLLILYLRGGVYLDNDVILTQSINSLTMNSIGMDKSSIGAFMAFEKGHKYLKLCLEEFVTAYTRIEDLIVSGSEILSTVLNKNNEVVSVLPHHSFYTVTQSNSEACFQDTAGRYFSETIETIKKTYVAKLSSTFQAPHGKGLKRESVCGHLLTNYCVLCSDVH